MLLWDLRQARASGHALFWKQVLQTVGRSGRWPRSMAKARSSQIARIAWIPIATDKLMCRLRHHHRQLRPASRRHISQPCNPRASTLRTKLLLRQGLVFAACVGQPKLHLFDTRNYAKGTAVSSLKPFASPLFAGEFTSFDLRPHVPDQAGNGMSSSRKLCARTQALFLAAMGPLDISRIWRRSS